MTDESSYRFLILCIRLFMLVDVTSQDGMNLAEDIPSTDTEC